MSERMDAIKEHLTAQQQARKEAGGEWRRRGECKRCGACCDAGNINPESHKRHEAEMREKGLLKEDQHLSTICGTRRVMVDGQLGCRDHGTDKYPSGCAAFPATIEQWRLVMATCGYWFEWVEDRPRSSGKARRARA